MIPTISAYFALLIGIAIYSGRPHKRSSDKALDYFLGGRSLGIIPLAMTTTATYISASSFIGGPSLAYSRGLGWVFLATVQYPVSLLMMGILGKQLQKLGHKYKLYDLADYIQLRYASHIYTKFCALLITIVLLLGLLLALMGGSRLLQGVIPGLSYREALLIFSLILGVYTLLGGFRVVVLTDILQGAWMLLASGVLLFFLWKKVGGSTGLQAFAIENPHLFRPDSGGTLPLSYTINFIILVGFGMIVQPVSFSRLLAFDKRKSLRQSILISIVAIGSLSFLPHFIGFLGRILLPGLEQPDQLLGRISQLFRTADYGVLGDIFSGLLVSAMLAAIMSTADSTINTLGMTIYRHILPRCYSGHSEERHFQFSRVLAGAAITLMAVLALNPPKFFVLVNLYSLGLTQVTLFWPVVLGIFTRRPNVHAAFWSSLVGFLSYFLLNRFYPNFGGVKSLPYSLLLSAAAYCLAVSLGAHKADSPATSATRKTG